ncbi:type II toxin-antitoxin system VapC family toxin [Actinoallomurus sp. NPDC052274]|uniref:type II toxin-antitoxin system VapC family toxin n=1 Tax=Actinoallomurus sp. NPDC052274 TaxID=3155420 RepID=UPI0034223767
MIVIDNSALVEALIGASPSKELVTVVAEEQLHVPQLIDYEFRSALRGLLLAGKVTPSRAEGARIVKESLPLTRHSDDVTGDRAWDLRGDFNAYDATYVALAELLDCPLVTADAKIAREVRTVRVELH